jgi:hypothetical protein
MILHMIYITSKCQTLDGSILNSFIVFVYAQIPSEFLLRKVEHKYIDNKSLAGGTNNRTHAEVGWPRHESRADSR